MKKEDYKYEAHQFVFWKSVGKQYCVKCGLVSSNNDFSIWATQKGCHNEDHVSYASTRKKYTNKFDF